MLPANFRFRTNWRGQQILQKLQRTAYAPQACGIGHGFRDGISYWRDATEQDLIAHTAKLRTPTFQRGDRVTKRAGSSWTGLVVGEYATTLTPEGYAVESENEPGSVQIYPAAAIERKEKPNG